MPNVQAHANANFNIHANANFHDQKFYLSRLDSATGGNEMTWASNLLSSSITLSCFLAKSYNFTLSSNIPLDSESSATNSMIRWVLVPWNLKYKVEKMIGRNT